MSVSTQRLPVYPAPAPDEWMGSWLARLAHDNGLYPSLFLNMIGLDLGIPTVPVHVQTRLQAMTGLSPDQFAAMGTPLDPLRRFVTEEFKHRDLLGVQKVQICPHCLLEDPHPYIRRAWVRRSLTSCPRHGPLRDLCLQCKRYLHVIAAVPAQRRTYAPGEESIRTCWNCKADLTHPLAPVTPPPKSTPLRTLGGVVLDDAQYDRFRTALWTYLHDFRVGLFIGPEGPEHYVMPRRTLHVTDARGPPGRGGDVPAQRPGVKGVWHVAGRTGRKSTRRHSVLSSTSYTPPSFAYSSPVRRSSASASGSRPMKSR